MASRPHDLTAAAPPDEPGVLAEGTTQEGARWLSMKPPQSSRRIRAAMRFARRCHARQRRDSDGAPFIEHPIEVARLLTDAGCRDAVIAAGLLHDVLENAAATARELTARFGTEVTALVQAVSEDVSVHDYRERSSGYATRCKTPAGMPC
jgi:(p)ppGpp synthase/HD superfamily hydrolase